MYNVWTLLTFGKIINVHNMVNFEEYIKFQNCGTNKLAYSWSRFRISQFLANIRSNCVQFYLLYPIKGETPFCLKLVGDDVVLFTTDGNWDQVVQCGQIQNVYATVDFGSGKNLGTSRFNNIVP